MTVREVFVECWKHSPQRCNNQLITLILLCPVSENSTQQLLVAHNPWKLSVFHKGPLVSDLHFKQQPPVLTKPRLSACSSHDSGIIASITNRVTCTEFTSTSPIAREALTEPLSLREFFTSIPTHHTEPKSLECTSTLQLKEWVQDQQIHKWLHTRFYGRKNSHLHWYLIVYICFLSSLATRQQTEDFTYSLVINPTLPMYQHTSYANTIYHECKLCSTLFFHYWQIKHF